MRKRRMQSAADLFEIAGEWALKAEAGLSPRDVVRLETWLDADACHRTAYDAVREAGQALERHGVDEEMMAMRHAALKARPERRLPPHALAASLAATLLVAGAAGWWGADHVFDVMAAHEGAREARTARYVTAAGERATVTLADGSVLTLNTDSVAETVFDRDVRTVRLVKGQALFTVAHDPSRPFEVRTGDRRVTAVGTAFDVLMLSGELRVAMLDGVVRVSDKSGPVQTLSKGEMMTARSDGSIAIRKVDTARLAGWRDGVIYFEETPLSEAVAEMNRYAHRPILVADTHTGALRVSGAFRVAEADVFAATLAELFPLSIKHSVDGRTILSSSSL